MSSVTEKSSPLLHTDNYYSKDIQELLDNAKHHHLRIHHKEPLMFLRYLFIRRRQLEQEAVQRARENGVNSTTVAIQTFLEVENSVKHLFKQIVEMEEHEDIIGLF